jgi:hypothetical protein
MENPQVKNEPASCQKATVRIAVLTGVRVAGVAAEPAGCASPSGARPMDSGESRITMRQSGSMPTSTASPIRA